MQLTKDMDVVVEGWQRKLLQMDRHNARLYFKGRGSAIRIETPNCLAVVESLESSRHGLTFDYLDRPIGRRQQVPLDLVQSGDEDESDSPDEPIIHLGDVVADCPNAELPRRLGNLMRRAKSWDQEQGLSVLFLAIGFFEYIDKDGEQATAPLLLLPVTLDRASLRDPFVIEDGDDDVEDFTVSFSIDEDDFGITQLEDLPELEAEIANALGGATMDFGGGDGSKAKAWIDIWSAGQGVGSVHDIPKVADLVARMEQEYMSARQHLNIASRQVNRTF